MMEEQSEVGYNNPLTAHSKASNNSIFCIPSVFKGIPPSWEICQEKKFAALRFRRLKTTEATSSPVGEPQLVGKRIVIFDEFADGALKVVSVKAKPLKPHKAKLSNMWINNKRLTYDVFILCCTRARHDERLIVQDTESDDLIWTGGAMTIMETYSFLSENGFIRKHMKKTEIFNLFKATFIIPQVRQARSLQCRQMSYIEQQNFDRRKRRFRETLDGLFHFAVRKLDNERR